MNKKAAIAEVVRVRDQLAIIRERLFQLSAVTAARTREVEGFLIDCAAAGRVFGAPIGLPDWNNVLATPGHPSAHSLEPGLGPLRASDVVVRLRHFATVLRLRPSRVARALFVSPLS
jgi:hypothetical protein